MTATATTQDDNQSLALRAAWLHYAGGFTQVEVASRLGITNVKAHRLIARANQSGAVKIRIEGAIGECVAMEATLARRFGLDYCEVVPDLHEPSLPLKALGAAGGAFLQRAIEGAPKGLFGIGHGRTLAAAVAAMPQPMASGVRFVSLLGGLTRNFAANPHDVMHRLADKTGAAAFVMPVPFLANSAEDRRVLLAQRGVRQVFDLVAEADLLVAGIGTVAPDAQLVAAGMIEPEAMLAVKQGGGVGELLGHFFDAGGRPVAIELTARTLCPDLERLRDRRIVAIAGGPEKAEAIRAVLASGYLDGLITDEGTAQALLGEAP